MFGWLRIKYRWRRSYQVAFDIKIAVWIFVCFLIIIFIRCLYQPLNNRLMILYSFVSNSCYCCCTVIDSLNPWHPGDVELVDFRYNHISLSLSIFFSIILVSTLWFVYFVWSLLFFLGRLLFCYQFSDFLLDDCNFWLRILW